MALTPQQLWTAETIDTRVRKLMRAGQDDSAILVAMVDHMPTFKQLLDTMQPGDLNELTRRLPGFHRYARILETLAAGIQSGAVAVPK